MTTGYRTLSGTVTGQAGSLITFLDALLDIGAGSSHWEKVFAGTNKAVYRAKAGERYFLRVDDTQTTYANVRGYHAMSDVDTGTDPFPTTAQQPTWCWMKSRSADATARQIQGIATDRFILLMPLQAGFTDNIAVTPGSYLHWWGEIVSQCAKGSKTCLRASYSNSAYAEDIGYNAGLSGNPFSLNSNHTPGNQSGNTVAWPDIPESAPAPYLGAVFGPSANLVSSPKNGYGVRLYPVWVGSRVDVPGGGAVLRGYVPFVRATDCPSTLAASNASPGDTFTDGSGQAWTLQYFNGAQNTSNGYPFFAVMNTDGEAETL